MLNQEDERIPLSKSAAEILMNQYSLRDQRSDEARERNLVFFTKTGKPWGKSRSVIWRLHREIRTKANLPEGFRMLHGLRHHFLTMHAVAGTPAPILMRLATHKDLATTQRYIDIADADLLAAADKTKSLITATQVFTLIARRVLYSRHSCKPLVLFNCFNQLAAESPKICLDGTSWLR